MTLQWQVSLKITRETKVKHISPLRKFLWALAGFATVVYLGLIIWTDNRIHSDVSNEAGPPETPKTFP